MKVTFMRTMKLQFLPPFLLTVAQMIDIGSLAIKYLLIRVCLMIQNFLSQLWVAKSFTSNLNQSKCLLHLLHPYFPKQAIVLTINSVYLFTGWGKWLSLKMLGMSATGRLLLDSVVPINVNTLWCKLFVSCYLLEDHYTSEKLDVNVCMCRTINVLRTPVLF